MAFRLSTGMRNAILGSVSFAHAIQNGKIQIYSGTQPATADAAPTGTLLATITDGSGAHVSEVQATGTITLNSGASGSVDTVAVDGIDLIDGSVAFNGSLTQTAVDLAAAINSSRQSPEYTATSSGAVVTIKAALGAGVSANALNVTQTTTTINASSTDMAGGQDAANGLRMGSASSATVGKSTDQTWSGAGVATGTAGWFRFVGAVADSGAVDNAAEYLRFDGNIGTSGADLNLTNGVTIASGATQTVASMNVSLPAS